MFRQDFGPGDAVFTYDTDSTLSFWMKNTPVSLDIIYFDAAGHWLNTHGATEPFSLEGCLSMARRNMLEISAGGGGAAGHWRGLSAGSCRLRSISGAERLDFHAMDRQIQSECSAAW